MWSPPALINVFYTRVRIRCPPHPLQEKNYIRFKLNVSAWIDINRQVWANNRRRLDIFTIQWTAKCVGTWQLRYYRTLLWRSDLLISLSFVRSIIKLKEIIPKGVCAPRQFNCRGHCLPPYIVIYRCVLDLQGHSGCNVTKTTYK